jgi:hypothetical protein
VQAATYEWTREPSRLRFRSTMVFFFLYRARLAKTARGVAPLNLRPPKNRANKTNLACARLNRTLSVVLACFGRAPGLCFLGGAPVVGCPGGPLIAANQGPLVVRRTARVRSKCGCSSACACALRTAPRPTGTRKSDLPVSERIIRWLRDLSIEC